jgi:archaellum component FlaC
MEHAENIHTVKKLRKKEDHLRTILEWYDNVYREIIYARNHLETIREDMQEGVEDDSVITNQLNSEDSILEDLNNRCLNQINKLSNRIEDIKRQYRKDE